MLRSWKLGTAFGIGIYVHWTFLVLPLWIFFSNVGQEPVAVALSLVLLSLAVFGCIILHELGHALMARYFDIPTRDITLYPIGGVARLERMSEQPWEEFAIALAGPAVNFLIAGVLGVVLALVGQPGAGSEWTPPAVGGFVFNLLAANVILACFNLLPAFPMDGGRILRALLAVRCGRLRATEIAARLGTGMSLLFFVVGVLAGVWSLLLLSLFVFLLGQQELAFLRWRQRRRQAQDEVLDVEPVEDELADLGRPADPSFSGFTWDPRSRLWVKWHNGRAVQQILVEPDLQP